jgi:hypothetical protein
MRKKRQRESSERSILYKKTAVLIDQDLYFFYKMIFTLSMSTHTHELQLSLIAV